jgi:hypothetical protein
VANPKPAYDDLVKFLEVVGLVGVGLFGFLRELKRHEDDLGDIREVFYRLKGRPKDDHLK